jgi:hypothetical protein
MSASREAYLSKLYLDRAPRAQTPRDRAERRPTAPPRRRERRWGKGLLGLLRAGRDR